jgi:hypothetical protein
MILVWTKSGKDGTRTPLSSQIGDEISKKTGEKPSTHWASSGHETQFKQQMWWSTEFGPVLSFPESIQPITAAAMCTVAINILEPLIAFNAEFQYFIHLFNKISWLCE